MTLLHLWSCINCFSLSVMFLIYNSIYSPRASSVQYLYSTTNQVYKWSRLIPLVVREVAIHSSLSVSVGCFSVTWRALTRWVRPVRTTACQPDVPRGRTCEGEAMRGGEKGKSVLLVLRGGAVQASTFLLSCSDVAFVWIPPKELGLILKKGSNIQMVILESSLIRLT